MINFTTLQTLFANQGLDLKDLVLLSGTSHLTFSLRDAFLQR
jgi:peroxidase